MEDMLFGGIAAWFTVPALLGTTVFVTKAALTLFAGDADGDIGEVGDIGEFGDADDADMDGDGNLKILSITTIAAFGMGFGWLGLAAYRGTGLGETISMAIAIAGGLGMGYLMAWLLAALYRMQTSGNVTMHEAVDHEADVYLSIPPRRAGRGEIRVVIDERMRSYPAVTDDPDPIDRNARVLVVAINPDNTATVARL